RENQHDGIYDTHNEQIRQAYQPPWIRHVKLCILCQCNEKVPYPVKRLVKLQFEAVEKGHKAIILVSFCSSQSRIGSPNLGKISRHMQISRAGTTLNQGYFLVLKQVSAIVVAVKSEPLTGLQQQADTLMQYPPRWTNILGGVYA